LASKHDDSHPIKGFADDERTRLLIQDDEDKQVSTELVMVIEELRTVRADIADMSTLQEMRARVVEQQESFDHNERYHMKVKSELAYAEQRMKDVKTACAKLDAAISILSAELKATKARYTATSDVLQANKEELTHEEETLVEEMSSLEQQVADVQLDTEAERQVLEGLRKYADSHKSQLQELKTHIDEAECKLVEHRRDRFQEEAIVLSERVIVQQAALAMYKREEADKKMELTTAEKQMKKNLRELKRAVDLDSRALAIKLQHEKTVGIVRELGEVESVGGGSFHGSDVSYPASLSTVEEGRRSRSQSAQSAAGGTEPSRRGSALEALQASSGSLQTAGLAPPADPA